MKLVYMRPWLWYLLGGLIFPMGMFYWARAMALEDPEAVRRLITGTIVFGVSIMTANSLSDQLIQDRFQVPRSLRAMEAAPELVTPSAVRTITAAVATSLGLQFAQKGEERR